MPRPHALPVRELGAAVGLGNSAPDQLALRCRQRAPPVDALRVEPGAARRGSRRHPCGLEPSCAPLLDVLPGHFGRKLMTTAGGPSPRIRICRSVSRETPRNAATSFAVIHCTVPNGSLIAGPS